MMYLLLSLSLSLSIAILIMMRLLLAFFKVQFERHANLLAARELQHFHAFTIAYC